MKIKKGMTVKVKDNLKAGKEYDGIVFSEEMKRYRGHIGKVTAIETIKNRTVFQIEGCEKPSDKYAEEAIFAIAKIFDVCKDKDMQAKKYCFTKSMVDIVDTTLKDDFIEGTITVDKEQLKEQLEEERRGELFKASLPDKSVGVQVITKEAYQKNRLGEIEKGYKSSGTIALAKNQSSANMSLFITLLDTVKNISKTLLNSEEYNERINNMLKSYIEKINNDLSDFDIR